MSVNQPHSAQVTILLSPGPYGIPVWLMASATYLISSALISSFKVSVGQHWLDEPFLLSLLFKREVCLKSVYYWNWRCYKFTYSTATAASHGANRRPYPSYIRRAQSRKLEFWRTKQHFAGGIARYKLQAHKCSKLTNRFHRRSKERFLASNNEPAFWKHVNRKLGSSYKLSHKEWWQQYNYWWCDESLVFQRLFRIFIWSVLPKSAKQRVSASCCFGWDFSPAVVCKAMLNSKRTFLSEPFKIPSVSWYHLAYE